MMKVNVLKENSGDLWRVKGSFGSFSAPLTEEKDTLKAADGTLAFTAKTESTRHGVFVRRDEVKNLSDAPVTLSTLLSRFSFDGGEYAVYTQYNGWQNESMGGWQPLVTEVCLRGESFRPCHSAAPFLALWSEQANRGVAFHLLAASAWEIRVAKERYLSDAQVITLSLGLLGEGLSLPLEAGECFALPEILYYEFTDKTDMAAYKLHGYLNERAPRRAMPVVYNTWLYKFDHFTAEDVLTQIEKAAALGVEYFVIDAGWFGEGEMWGDSRGDWEENLTFGFRGRMTEIAEAVRRAGMGFGFWLEPETAAHGAKAPVAHPEYYIKSARAYHLDFANPAALEYIFRITCGLIERYGAECIKFDFNVDLFEDPHGTAFAAYVAGHDRFVTRLKEKYPSLYLENCASGGTRMAIKDGLLFDSFWPSDNQSPYRQMRFLADTLKRMPPAWFSRYVVARSAEGLTPVYPYATPTDKLIAGCDATWDHVEGVHPDYLAAFLSGGAPCFSCDLTAFSEKDLAWLRRLIADFKANRDFWRDTVCHILTDTPSLLALEYASVGYDRAEAVVCTGSLTQRYATLFPLLAPDTVYTVSGKGIDPFEATGKALSENGVRIPLSRSFDGYRVSFLRKSEI